MTFSGRDRFGQVSGEGDGVDPDGDWQPVPLELPLEVPYGRQQPITRPTPRGGEHKPDPDGDAGGHVIIIDLA